MRRDWLAVVSALARKSLASQRLPPQSNASPPQGGSGALCAQDGALFDPDFGCWFTPRASPTEQETKAQKERWASELKLAKGRDGKPALMDRTPVDTRPVRAGVLSHQAALSVNTGRTHGAKAWAEGRERQAVLHAQTERVAAVLDAAGVPTRLASDVCMVGEVTGEVERAESWRAIRFLPLVAQRDRKPVASGLKLWLRGPDATYVRYAVVTSGTRIPIGGDLKKRQAEHTANLRRWSSEAGERYGVELVLRATEYTVNAHGVHLHSNIAYRLERPLEPERWSEFLSWSRQRLQATWQDCGQLRDADEVVKYCVKPADLERLDADGVVWLFEQTYRSKMVQPLGRFAAWMRDLERDRLKVAMVYEPTGKAYLRLVTKMQREPSEGGGEVGENVICGRTLPQARWCPWSEPVSLVMGYTETPVTAEGVRRLAVLRARQVQARGWWDANGAPDPALLAGLFRVHTDRPTVQTLATLTLASGDLVDPETGELVFEPDPGRLAVLEADRQAMQANHRTALDTADQRLAVWHAAAPEREAECAAWALVLAAEKAEHASRLRRAA